MAKQNAAEAAKQANGSTCNNANEFKSHL